MTMVAPFRCSSSNAEAKCTAMSNRAVQQRLKAKDNQDLIDLEESLGNSDSDDDEPVSTSSSTINAFSLV